MDLDNDVIEPFKLQPWRGPDSSIASDLAIYRFHEDIGVCGATFRALIHEQFCDGIIFAINFKVNFTRPPIQMAAAT